MPLHVTAANVAADAVAATITEISLHSAQPSASGSNEITGGGYGRAAEGTDFTFGAAASGYASVADTVEFDVTDETISHVGLWAGAQFAGYDALPEPRVIVGADTFLLQVVRVRLDGLTLLS